MSGGIDSTVTAMMLHDEGYDVVGITMKTWDYASAGASKKETGCCNLDSFNDARMAAVQHGFPHFVLDIREEFGDFVIENFVDEYLAGRTPNPCVLCNTHIKWRALLKRADAALYAAKENGRNQHQIFSEDMLKETKHRLTMEHALRYALVNKELSLHYQPLISLSSGAYNAQLTLSGGVATFTIAPGSLSSGANTLTATYSGDATYTAASATTVVTLAPFVMSVPSLSPVSPGSSATGSVTLTAGNTYSGTMNLTCSLTASPAGAQSVPACSLNPANMNLASGGSGTAVLTVTTTAASPASAGLNLWPMGGGSLLAALVMFGMPSRRRRWASALVVLLVMAGAGAIGCGGGGGSIAGGGGGNQKSVQPSTPATTAGSYTLTVTATDAANPKLTSSANVLVTVQ